MLRRVLIADDERVIRIVTRQLLLADGAKYEVDEVEDGHEALDKIAANDYDVLITDLLMPNCDGIELIKTLHMSRPQLPVVVVTGVTDDQSILSCFSSGAWDYVIKPINARQLRAIVARAAVAGGHLDQRHGDFSVSADDSDTIEFSAISDMEYVLRFRRFTEVLLRARLSMTAREDIRLAIEELGKNAIEWGNRENRDRRVSLAYCLTDDRITFRIEDEGNGFDYDRVDDPSDCDPIAHLKRREEAGKRPGGYGIHIIKSVMDKVEYNDKGNSVVLTKFLS